MAIVDAGLGRFFWNQLTGISQPKSLTEDPRDSAGPIARILNPITGSIDYERQIQAEEREYQRNVAQTAEARAWQAQREDNATQRLAADLEAAGFNPWAVIGSGGSVQAAPAGSSSAASVPGSKAVKASKDLIGVMTSTAATVAGVLAVLKKAALI